MTLFEMFHPCLGSAIRAKTRFEFRTDGSAKARMETSIRRRRGIAIWPLARVSLRPDELLTEIAVHDVEVPACD